MNIEIIKKLIPCLMCLCLVLLTPLWAYADSFGPTVSIITPSDNGVVSKPSVFVLIQAWDVDATPSTPLVSKDGGAFASDAGIVEDTNRSCGTNCKVFKYTWDLTGYGDDSSHTIQFRSNDGTNNGDSRTITVTVRAANTGDGNLLKRDRSSQMCIDCHDLLSHSSQSTDTGYGNWETVCLDCHTPHGTTNIYLIREVIWSRSTVLWNTSGDANNSYVDSSPPGGTPVGVCEVCHTQTTGPGGDRWRNTGNADTHYDSGSGTQRCTECHSHTDGFKGSGECLTCHDGNPGLPAPVYVSRDVNGASGDFSLAYRHVYGGTVTNWDCIVCHREGDETAASAATPQAKTTSSHQNAQVEMRNVDNLSDATLIWDKNSIDDAMHSQMDTFCLRCHDSNGASAIAVKSDDSAVTLSPTNAEAYKPFNSTDDIDEGVGGGTVTPGATLTTWFGNQTVCENAGLTWTGSDCTDTRSRVLNVDSQFDTANPSHHAVKGARYTTTHAGECDASGDKNLNTQGECEGAGYTWTATGECITTHTSQASCEGADPDFVWGQWGAGAWVTRTLKNSTQLTTVRESASLHCSDCHTVDQNAHGGSSGFMLQASSIDDTCWLCHSSNVYNSGVSDANAALSRHDHREDSSRTMDPARGSKLGTYGANAGSRCLLCHGGAQYDGYGAIHGIPSGTDSRNSHERYRFIGGSTMSKHLDDVNDWTLGNNGTSCYFINPDPQPWSNCQHHGAGSSGSNNTTYGRGTSY